MVTVALVFFGAAWTLLAVYTYTRAESEFETGMELRGVGPDAVDRGGRERAVRRNRVVSVVLGVVGIGFLAWGLVA